MLVFRSIHEYSEWRNGLSGDVSTGFVPTMGFLHAGHISLVKASVKDCKYTVASIFVNPVQFNNKEDLDKYPRDEANDIELLEKAGCDVVFIPSVEEMYPDEVNEKYEFPGLDDVMEGAFRPGHFNGVAIVVSRLFRIIRPDVSYFGKKDYQQYMIVKELARREFSEINIIGIETVREEDGLAMSSRNVRLSEEKREDADMIFQLMKRANNLKVDFSPKEIEAHMTTMLSNAGFEKVEYVCIANGDTLKPLKNWSDTDHARIFVAAWLDNVRLIDNMELI
ncbi:MAG: pantoate--beta-alanine ligase [Marinilabiliales bacterium]|nr:MAG: pantoate--beta-alanine ligase [Marinilabiliales bacterium]